MTSALHSRGRRDQKNRPCPSLLLSIHRNGDELESRDSEHSRGGATFAFNQARLMMNDEAGQKARPVTVFGGSLALLDVMLSIGSSIWDSGLFRGFWSLHGFCLTLCCCRSVVQINKALKHNGNLVRPFDLSATRFFHEVLC